ncbi:MAG: YdcF family protein [Myxococcales bacterium]|nr:YdcF family protein [Myxococcales bacterium]
MLATLSLLVCACALSSALHRSRTGQPRAGRAAAVAAAAAAAFVALVAAMGGAVPPKLVGALAMPAGLLWLVGIAAIGEAWARGGRARFAATLVLWLAYTAIGAPGPAIRLYAAVESPQQPVHVPTAGPFDAVFVLGGGVDANPNDDPQLTRAGDRAMLGARLYLTGRTPHLIASGSSPPGFAENIDSAALTRTIWTELGVPDAAITTLASPYNTRQEIAAYRALAEEHGWHNIGLVTSAIHMRRALRLADRAGLDVTPLPCDFRGGDEWNGILSLVPQGSAFLLVHAATWELLGAATGR